jgi:hypothetical protein
MMTRFALCNRTHELAKPALLFSYGHNQGWILDKVYGETSKNLSSWSLSRNNMENARRD